MNEKDGTVGGEIREILHPKTERSDKKGKLKENLIESAKTGCKAKGKRV